MNDTTQNNRGQRLVIVSGAARGIGLDIARAFSRKQRHIVLLDRLEDVHAAASALQAEGGSAEARTVDLTDEADVASVVEAVCAKWGEVGVLVNNAGISGRKGADKTPVAETELADWERVFEINLTAAFLMCRACIPSMARARWGRIVNMSSQAARTRTERSNAHYATSKAALIGFSRGLAMEVAGHGITVNCIAPGRITTPMTAQTGAEVDKAYADRSAVGHVGLPADITAAAIFLASEDSSFITGATVDVNGGYSMN